MFSWIFIFFIMCYNILKLSIIIGGIQGGLTYARKQKEKKEKNFF